MDETLGDADETRVTGVPNLTPPVSTPPRRHRRRLFAFAALALLLTCACAAGSLWAVASALPEVVDRMPVPSMTMPSVSWVDDRYAVIQSPALNGGVAVYDSTSGDVRELEGFRLAGIEEAAPILWLQRLTARSVADIKERPQSVNQAGDGWDEPADGLFRWRCGSEEPPSRATTNRWQPSFGANGSELEVIISPTIGSSPSTARVKRADGRVIPLSIDLYKTFEPVGWSPSRRYFALVSLVHEGMEQPRPDVEEDIADLVEDSPISLMVFDMATGDLAGWWGLGDVRDDEVAHNVAWDPAQDVIYFHVVDDAPGGGTHALLADAPGSEGDLKLPEVPSEWSGANWRIVGVDESGVLVEVSSRSGASLWRTTRDRYEYLCEWPTGLLSVSVRDGRVLSMTAGPEGYSVRVSGLDLRDEREVWRSESFNGNPFVWIRRLVLSR